MLTRCWRIWMLIIFENITNGVVNLTLHGLTDFKKQAEQTLSFFTERKQTISAIRQEGDQVTIGIDYYAVLAIDLPNGPSKGEVLNLKGQSVFTFSPENTITRLTDIS
ncbi:hypothetical protein [Chitinophaga sp. HK235]|uniref:hypothetical protein n=1 Tax=Chitinophaga sp. HK235 TaxID=2952571 RepID=UPI001BAB5A05|nr:hypothetical protein [Chitinophaga sp. HK235]